MRPFGPIATVVPWPEGLMESAQKWLCSHRPAICILLLCDSSAVFLVLGCGTLEKRQAWGPKAMQDLMEVPPFLAARVVNSCGRLSLELIPGGVHMSTGKTSLGIFRKPQVSSV